MMRKLIFTIICLFSLPLFANEETVLVRAYNTVTGTAIIRLAEIVDVSAIQNSETLKQLQNIVLGDAPALGDRRVYTNKAIAEAIRKNVKSKEWNLKIPHRVIVENRGHEISREAVEAQLQEKWKPLCNSDCEIKITNVQLPAVSEIYKNKTWNLEHDGQLPKGNVQARIFFQGADGRPVYYWISAQTQVRRKVPVVNRAVAQNSRIQSEDVRYEWRDLTFATDTPASEAEYKSQQAKFVMQSGDVIWKNSLIREKAVRRGETVRVYLGDSAWEVAIQAITEQDGYIGDTVNLRNPSTNKVISGRVVASGEVEIR